MSWYEVEWQVGAALQWLAVAAVFGVVLGGEGSQIRSGEIHERVDAGCNERWGLLGT